MARIRDELIVGGFFIGPVVIYRVVCNTEVVEISTPFFGDSVLQTIRVFCTSNFVAKNNHRQILALAF